MPGSDNLMVETLIPDMIPVGMAIGSVGLRAVKFGETLSSLVFASLVLPSQYHGFRS